MKKRLLIIFIVLLMAINLSFAGNFSEFTSLNIISTEYFDIIYPDTSAQTASLLVEKADIYYEEIAKTLDAPNKFRISVTLTSDINLLNGYFNSYPYNHIVLYDTITTDDFALAQKNLILDVFYHELVHAVSLNLRTKLGQVSSNIFSDLLSYQKNLYFPLSLVEGVTVSLENRDDNGRLSNGFATQIIKESKIEGCFPSWTEISGARDIYPVGAMYYIFGGAFSLYLQNTYGMEKYSELYNEAGHLNWGLFNSIFKKVYKKDITVAWMDFYSSIEIPISITTGHTILNNDCTFSNFLNYENNLYYYNNTQKTIYNLEGKVLTSTSYEPQLSISSDYLLSSNVTNDLKELRLYNVSSKKQIATYKDLRLGSLLYDSSNNLIIAGVKNTGMKSSVEFLNISSEQAYSPLELSYGNVAENIQNLGNGECAFILKGEGITNIVFYNFETGELRSLKFNNSLLIKGLNNTSSGLCFSWVDKNDNIMLPRFGLLKTDGSVYLSDIDVQGGVNDPTLINSYVYYNSKRFDHDEINNLNINTFKLKKVDSKIEIIESVKEEENFLNNLDQAKKYNAISNFQDITFFPMVSLLTNTPSGFAPEEDFTNNFGFGVYTQDPTETYSINNYFCYLKEDNQVQYNFEFVGDFKKRNYAIGGNVIYNIDYNTFDYNIFSNMTSSWELPKELGSLGYEIDLAFPSLSLYPEIGFAISPFWHITKRRSLNYFGNSGLLINPYYQGWYDFNTNNYYGYWGINAILKLSNILPIQNLNNLTYNLPTTFSFYKNDDSLQLNTDLTLLSIEIQKGIDWAYLYYNRITLGTEFNLSTISKLQDTELDYMFIYSELDQRLVIGSSLEQIPIQIRFGLIYVPTNSPKWNLRIDFKNLQL